LLTYNIERINLAEAVKITPGHESPSLVPLQDEAWVAVSAMVKSKEVAEIMDALSALGARSILVTPITNCRF